MMADADSAAADSTATDPTATDRAATDDGHSGRPPVRPPEDGTAGGPENTDRSDDTQLGSDAQIAHHATGKLAEFNRAGVLGVADVHTATAIGRIGGEAREDVQLAIALTVRALRTGSVCIDLRTIAEAVFADTTTDDARTELDVSSLAWPEPDGWLEACASSPVITLDHTTDLEDEPAAAVNDDARTDGHSSHIAQPAPTPSPVRPLRMADGLLYLERYWQQQETVRRVLRRRATDEPPTVDLDRLRDGLTRVFDSSGLDADEPDLQRLAAAVGVLQWVSVVAGGPGTGKTTTVAGLLALLHDQLQPGTPAAEDDSDHDQLPVLRVALAAPTGKAAARLEEAVRSAAGQLVRSDQIPATAGDWITQLSSSTLHRLLGWLPQSRSRFRHNARNHLPYDVVVVDEMSMVSLTLMARLLEALRPDARLILVGDPDQLSSVEAGAVLADIVGAPGRADPRTDAALATVQAADPMPDPGPTNGVVRLRHTWRFGGAIDDLAQAIRASDDDQVVDILRSGRSGLIFTETEPPADANQHDATSDLDRSVAEPGDDPHPDTVGGDRTDQQLVGPESVPAAALRQLRADVVSAGRVVSQAARSGDIPTALTGLDQHRLLCAHRRGPFGVTRWGAEAERWLIEAIGDYATAGEWYPGRPLLITANDYELSLYNGDTGVVMETPSGIRAAFARGGAPTLIAPARLDSVQTMHALTVHRAQGSQFQAVTFVVPPPESPLLTRELLYTAVTRATDRVHVIGTEAAIRRATRRPANRASGLRSLLAQG